MRCCVPGCNNDTNNTMASAGLTFHRFPKEVHHRNLWKVALNIFDWEPDECSAVCSEHFKQDAFYETASGIRSVRNDAVPVSDIDVSSILQMNKVKREPDGEEMVDVDFDVKDVKIKQEVLIEVWIPEISTSTCGEEQPNGQNNMDTVVKREYNEEETGHVIPDIPIKQETITDDEITEGFILNYSEGTPNGAEVAMNDTSDNLIEKKGNAKKESFVTSENEKEQEKSSCGSLLREFKSRPKTPDEFEENLLFCPYCEFRCRNESVLTKHIRKHTDKQSEAFGNYRYKGKRVNSKHRKTQSNEKPFACGMCDYRCKANSLLIAHTRTHTGEKPFACTLCDYRCIEKSNLNKHMKFHTGEKPFACDVCDHRCYDNSSLITHMRTHTGEKPYACTICDYRCKVKAHLTTHMRTHTGEKPFVCAICDYRCNEKSNLNTHMVIHTGEKPFACALCDYRCNRKTSLIAHITTHSREKPFACAICDYSCKLNTSLTRHMRTHTQEKPFACSICDYRCKETICLTRHMRSHAAKKPFACATCDYRCNKKSNLTSHMRTHTGEKPFACGICDYRCYDKSSLTRHMRTHSQEKPFACAICDYCCKEKIYLTRHMRTHLSKGLSP